jgi:hypothetical protein
MAGFNEVPSAGKANRIKTLRAIGASEPFAIVKAIGIDDNDFRDARDYPNDVVQSS